jgi:flagellar motor switch protein FliN/FliY
MAEMEEVPANGESMQSPASEPARTSVGLDVLLDFDLPLSVRFGMTEMTVAALAKLGVGSVIDLDRLPEDPVDVLVNGRLVARGEVVVVAGNYGVRITEIVGAQERMNALAG